jgi:hypothetical protein
MVTDVILENEKLFHVFVSYYKTLNIGAKTLVAEMNKDGITMDVKRLQRFITHGNEKRVTQKAYIWLLARHGLELKMGISGAPCSMDGYRNYAKSVIV